MQTAGQSNREDQETSESFLVQQALNGNQEAFEAQVSRYKQALFGLIYRYVGEYHEAEDVLQQVWLQLYHSLATLRLHVHIKPSLFMSRVIAAWASCVIGVFTLSVCPHFLRALPHTYRPVVWHFYTNKLTYAEIGRILGIAGSTEKTHFKRARPLLPAAFVTP